MNHRFVLGVMVIFVMFSYAHVNAQSDAKALLENYSREQHAFAALRMKSVSIITTDDTETHQKKYRRDEADLYREGQKIGLLIQNWEIETPDSRIKPQDPQSIDTFNAIWDGKQWFSYIAPVHNATGLLSIGSERHRADRYIANGYTGASLDGIFYGDLISIEVVLSHASKLEVLDKKERINGVDCVVLKAVTPNGLYTIWFDPQHGYQISQAEIQKSNDDLLFGKPIAKDKFEYPSGAPKFLSLNKESYELKYWNVQFQEFGNHWIPVEAEYRATTTYSDSNQSIYYVRHKRELVDTAPDFNVVHPFIPDVPDGTRVRLLDQSSANANIIPQVWKNKKSEPQVDRKITNIIETSIADFKSQKHVDLNNVNPVNVAQVHGSNTNSPPMTVGNNIEQSNRFIWIIVGIAIVSGIGASSWLMRKSSRKE